ncbi:L,D-transpeptidase family protein [Rufibacter roseus]|uniref:Murein L,D-transpeptidase family protein n=1 Tax=Rufibacter roseus TaxID=1567108 RepID=A0ABW2DM44_9BACT|nr:L,D-transpeptidase family protein [Rufibacter roseus]
MKHAFILLLLAGLLTADSFKDQQLKHERVQTAYQEKKAGAERLLKSKSLSLNTLQLYMRAFKQEEVLEVWAKNKTDQNYQLLITYPFCSMSGTLGPKRQEGDLQIPEGYYFIDRFNPQSNFYLSLGINYPNAADKIKGKGRLGGDIFIHGACVTIGCITITDDKIKEVYLLAAEAFNNGQTKIPVHIFPARYSTTAYTQLQQEYANKKPLLSFWENLKGGYTYFEKNKKLPTVQVNAAGNYVFR